MTDLPRPNPELSEQDAELISAYIDDMLSTAERAQFETRLQANRFLRAELRATQQTIQWMGELPTLKAPRNYTLTKEAIAPIQPTNVVVIPRVIRRINWMSAAAALVVALFGLTFILSNMNLMPKNPAVANSAQEIAALATQSSTSMPMVAQPGSSASDSDGSGMVTMATADDAVATSGLAADAAMEEMQTFAAEPVIGETSADETAPSDMQRAIDPESSDNSAAYSEPMALTNSAEAESGITALQAPVAPQATPPRLPQLADVVRVVLQIVVMLLQGLP